MSGKPPADIRRPTRGHRGRRQALFDWRVCLSRALGVGHRHQ